MPVIQQNTPGNAGTAPYPGLLVTFSDIAKAALRSVGAIEPGEEPTAAEMQACLFTGNQMMDSWQAQRLMIYSINRLVFQPLTLQQTYTVGPGGDISIPRPPRITSVSVISQPTSTNPLELPLEMLDDQQWQDIPVKSTTGALPQSCYDDDNFPLRGLNFWPVPVQNIQFAIYIWQTLTQFADTNTTLYSFPPAYLRAIRYALAVELAAEFPGDPELVPLVVKLAEQSIDVVKSLNRPSMRMACDPALVNPSSSDLYNWLTDEPAGR